MVTRQGKRPLAEPITAPSRNRTQPSATAQAGPSLIPAAIDRPPQSISRRLDAVVAFCAGHARSVVFFALVVAAVCAIYAGTQFRLNSDINALLPVNVEWRQRELAFERAFRRLNLMDAWPFGGSFDAIFCRNVMIYFDAATKAALVERLTQKLVPGGWLYIGHSESLLGAHPGLQLAGRTTYRRDQ